MKAFKTSKIKELDTVSQKHLLGLSRGHRLGAGIARGVLPRKDKDATDFMPGDQQWLVKQWGRMWRGAMEPWVGLEYVHRNESDGREHSVEGGR